MLRHMAFFAMLFLLVATAVLERDVYRCSSKHVVGLTCACLREWVWSAICFAATGTSLPDRTLHPQPAATCGRHWLLHGAISQLSAGAGIEPAQHFGHKSQWRAVIAGGCYIDRQVVAGCLCTQGAGLLACIYMILGASCMYRSGSSCRFMATCLG